MVEDLRMEYNYLTLYGNIIFESSKSISIDIAESAIDQLFSDNFWKDMPIFDTAYKVGKTIVDIRNAYILKHILVFSQKLHDGKLDESEIKKHYEFLENHPKRKYQEIEVLLQSASRHRKYIQDCILGNFYRLYCDPSEEFDWHMFERFAYITEELIPLDLPELKRLYDEKILRKKNFDSCTIGRLGRLGLVDYFNGEQVSDSNGADADYYYAKITSLGEAFWKLGVSDVKISHDIDGDMRII